MKLLHVGAASLNQTPLDWKGNRERIIAAIDEAISRNIALLVLPEQCIPGYGCEDAFLSPEVHQRSLLELGKILPFTRGITVCLGLPCVVQGEIFNGAALVRDGSVEGIVLKHALPRDGIHYEPRWFKSWSSGVVTSINVDGREVPVGDLIFEISGVRIGLEICEDAWVEARPGVSLAAAEVDIILNPSASHFAFGKVETRKKLVIESSRRFQCSYVYANANGNESGRIIYDGGSILASHGELIGLGPRLFYADHAIVSATIDIEESQRRRSVAARGESSTSFHQAVRSTGELPFSSVAIAPAAAPSWEQRAMIKEEEFLRAVSLGLFDYLRKSKSQGFVVSLSGGADSTACACLAATAFHLAWKELGTVGVQSRFPHLKLNETPEASMQQLLCCVYQATNNSSSRTAGAAKAIAEALQAQFYSVDVEPIVNSYCSLLEHTVGVSLTWEAHDVLLQNIQARSRGPFVWMLANLRNSLLLATSNRSEAAVGYTTMDGDTCGGLSPIGGIDKAFLLHWLAWLRDGGCVEVGSLPAVDLVLEHPPTAELRPLARAQTDESDLMPYVVLDAIERLAIRDRLGPSACLAEISAQFHNQYSEELLTQWVQRFFRLWSINQWKRERYAPSFHLDDENLDPKTWCRFPILSGGFVDELAELRQKL